jgi:hypothetical protein
MHARIKKSIFGKYSRMINSGSMRDRGVVRGWVGKLVKTAMIPKRLRGLHVGGKNV